MQEPHPFGMSSAGNLRTNPRYEKNGGPITSIQPAFQQDEVCPRMKIEKHRKRVKTLYVLGAGASHDLSHVAVRKNDFATTETPLDKNFLKRLKDSAARKGWQKDSIEYLEAEWLDRDDLLDSGLESAIISRAGQYDFLSSLHPRITRGKASNAAYINHLSHLIGDYLKRCKSNSSGNTRLFIDRLFPKGQDAAEYENRVITFNYDTLIERPLIERGLSRKKIYFDRIALKKGDGTRRNSDDAFPHPLVVKLHGSTNWRCDERYFDSIISGKVNSDEKEEIWIDDHDFPNPKDLEAPLIIPPVPNKPITAASVFRHLWTVAYEYLHEAENLVIVGYSCPPTDTLARTMFTHFSAKRLKKITIVDPDAVALSKYRSLIPEKVRREATWTYYSTFSEHINALSTGEP